MLTELGLGPAQSALWGGVWSGVLGGVVAALCPGAPLVHGAFPLGSSLESSLTATPYIFLFIVGVRKLYVNHGTTHQQPDFNHLGTGLAGANFFSINLNHPGWRMLAPVKLGWCHGTQSA